MTRRQRRGGKNGRVTTLWTVLALLGLVVVLLSCDNSGSSGSVSPPPAVNPQLDETAALGLVGLYQSALVHEDVDRLRALLNGDGGAFGHQTFLAFMADAFWRFIVIDLQVTEISLQLVTEPFTVSFRETLSVIDPNTLEQRTRSVQTTWRLLKQTDGSGTVTLLIANVTQAGPEFVVTTRGQLQAGVPASLEVREISGRFAMNGGEVIVPETGDVTVLRAASSSLQGSFVPPLASPPQPLRVRIFNTARQEKSFTHGYRVRLPGEGAIEHVAVAGHVELRAVAPASDGTVWVGGPANFPGALARIIQVDASGRTVVAEVQPTIEDLPEAAVSQIEDIVIDRLGRIHSLFLARLSGREPETGTGVVGNGDVVLDPRHPDTLCQTVNVLAASYPFRAQGEASASTRMLAADAGAIWLFGSDGGVALVSDAFREGQCPDGEAEVRYDPVFRRGESVLLSNTVPALVESVDGTLWFGTAFGLTRLHNGQFTAVPFDPILSLRGDVTTFEAFFRAWPALSSRLARWPL